METLNDGFDFGPLEIANKGLIPKNSWQPKHTIILTGIVGGLIIAGYVIHAEYTIKKAKFKQLASNPSKNENSCAKIESNHNTESEKAEQPKRAS